RLSPGPSTCVNIKEFRRPMQIFSRRCCASIKGGNPRWCAIILGWAVRKDDVEAVAQKLGHRRNLASPRRLPCVRRYAVKGHGCNGGQRKNAAKFHVWRLSDLNDDCSVGHKKEPRM